MISGIVRIRSLEGEEFMIHSYSSFSSFSSYFFPSPLPPILLLLFLRLLFLSLVCSGINLRPICHQRRYICKLRPTVFKLARTNNIIDQYGRAIRQRAVCVLYLYLSAGPVFVFVFGFFSSFLVFAAEARMSRLDLARLDQHHLVNCLFFRLVRISAVDFR